MTIDTLVVALGSGRWKVERPWGGRPPAAARSPTSRRCADGRVLVLTRRDHYVDPHGDCVHVLGSRRRAPRAAGAAGRIADAHMIAVDAQDRVWVVDRDCHEVVCFDADGRELRRPRHAPPPARAVQPSERRRLRAGRPNLGVGRLCRRPDPPLLAERRARSISFGEVGAAPGCVPHAARHLGHCRRARRWSPTARTTACRCSTMTGRCWTSGPASIAPPTSGATATAISTSSTASRRLTRLDATGRRNRPLPAGAQRRARHVGRRPDRSSSPRAIRAASPGSCRSDRPASGLDRGSAAASAWRCRRGGRSRRRRSPSRSRGSGCRPPMRAGWPSRRGWMPTDIIFGAVRPSSRARRTRPAASRRSPARSAFRRAPSRRW